MRFKPLARRITLAPMLVVALALTVAACSSSVQHIRCGLAISTAPSAPATPVPASSPAGSAAPSTRARQLGSRGADHRELGGVLQRQAPPSAKKIHCCRTEVTFEAAIKAFANFPHGELAGAKVTA